MFNLNYFIKMFNFSYLLLIKKNNKFSIYNFRVNKFILLEEGKKCVLISASDVKSKYY